MSSDTHAESHPPRLNPFAFPSDTDFSFVLLIASVIGASLFIYTTIYFSFSTSRQFYRDTFSHCWDLSHEAGVGLPESFEDYSNPKLKAALLAFEQCKAVAERPSTAWAVSGTVLMLVIAGLIYGLLPALKIRQAKFLPLNTADAPDVIAYLTNLCLRVGLSHPPTFLWNPLNPAICGLAIGRLGRSYVALSGGLVTLFYTDQPAFRAIMLHELAHLRNADLNKTYFAVATWWSFVVTALVPLAVRLFNYPLSDILYLSWRVLALALMVLLTRNNVLRTREVYADLRAVTWDGPSSALSQVLQTMPARKRMGWQSLFQVHPDPQKRSQALDDTSRLFHMGFWVAFGTGLAASLPIASMIPLLAPSLMDQPQLWITIFFWTSLIYAPLIVGVVGLGVWRATFAALVRGNEVSGVGGAGLGLGLGVILGQRISFEIYVNGLGNQIINQSSNLALFDILWSLLVLVSVLFFLYWVAAGASAWLNVTHTFRSLRRVCGLSVTIAGIWLAIWFGLIFILRYLGSGTKSLFLLNTIAVTSVVAANPLTFFLLVSLWVFPLAAWFWRAHTQLASRWDWALLDLPPQHQSMPQQTPLRPGLAFIIGLIGGASYFVLPLVIRLTLRLILPMEIRRSDQAIFYFHFGTIALAALMQSFIAVVVALKVPRLGWLHGLFAAFVAGCLMTVGILGSILVFGGEIDASFAWSTLSEVVNEGALLALPFALAASAVSGWFRRSEVPSAQAAMA